MTAKETPGWSSWYAMKRRCDYKDHPRYKDWGGRGITYCKEWEVFSVFIKDMGIKPTINHSLERKDNNLGYSKENCKWATPSEQALNRRTPLNELKELHISKNTKGNSFRVSINRNGVMKHSLSIKSLNDAIELRDLILKELN